MDLRSYGGACILQSNNAVSELNEIQHSAEG